MNLTKTTAILSHPSAIDSLHAEILKLHSTVDSLHRSLNDFGIAKTYFHDIISADIATFIAIVLMIITIIGYFSWRKINGIALKVKKDLSKQLKYQQGQLEEFYKNFDEKIKTFERKHDEQRYHTNRLMWFGSSANEEFEWALYWALEAIVSDLQITDGENIDYWFGKVDNILAKSLSKKDIGDSSKSTIETIEKLLSLNNETVNKKLIEVKEKYYKIMYGSK